MEYKCIVSINNKEEASKVLEIWKKLGNVTRTNTKSFIDEMFSDEMFSIGNYRLIYLKENSLEIYGTVNYAKGKGYTITTYNDFIKKYDYKPSKYVKQLQFESSENEIKVGDKVIVLDGYNKYRGDDGLIYKIIDLTGLRGIVRNTLGKWYGIEFNKVVRLREGLPWTPIKYEVNIMNTGWVRKEDVKKLNTSKYVKQLKFEKENYVMTIIERLEKLLMKDDVLKEEAYEVTVKRNDGPKVAPILTGLRNVTVTKSFDLSDLERHRFMISSKVDPHHIEDMLKYELKKKRVPINIDGIKVSLATPKSLEEALVKE